MHGFDRCLIDNRISTVAVNYFQYFAGEHSLSHECTCTELLSLMDLCSRRTVVVL